MKFLGVLKKVGGGIVKQVFPAAGPVIDLINAALPKDVKLSDNATGDQIQEAVKLLPPDKQAEILSQKIDVELAEIKANSVDLKTLAKVDMAGASTRPTIALMMAGCVCFITLVIVSLIGYAIGTDKVEMIKAVKDAWPLITALLGIPSSVLTYYFGKRTKEKEARYNLAAGQTPAAGLISGLVKAFKN